MDLSINYVYFICLWTYFLVIVKYVAYKHSQTSIIIHKCIFYCEKWIPRIGIFGTECKCIFKFCSGCQMAFWDASLTIPICNSNVRQQFLPPFLLTIEAIIHFNFVSLICVMWLSHAYLNLHFSYQQCLFASFQIDVGHLNLLFCDFNFHISAQYSFRDFVPFLWHTLYWKCFSSIIFFVNLIHFNYYDFFL